MAKPPSVFGSVHVGRSGPSISPTRLSLMTGEYLFVVPGGRIGPASPDDQARLIVFFVVGALISVGSEQLRRVERRERVGPDMPADNVLTN